MTETQNFTHTVKRYLLNLQDRICTSLETEDGSARFLHDDWQRDSDGKALGGGGRTRVLQEGEVFEQAGAK